METSIHITTERKKVEAMNAIAELPDDGRYEVVIKKTKKDRTSKQNASLHLYLRMLEQQFNDAGIDQRATWEKFKAGFNIPVTEHFLKEIFQSISFDMFGIKKTSQLSTLQMQQVYEAYNNGMSVKFGISAMWPVKEDK